MYQSKVSRLTILIFIILLGTGCSSNKPSVSEKYQGQAAKELFIAGEKALNEESFRKSVEYFEALDSLYPFSPYSEQAQLDLIYVYYKTDDYASTVATIDRFIHLYPRSDAIDYVYYMRGLAHFEQDRGILQKIFTTDASKRDINFARQAYADFSQLLQRFPKSRYAEDAKQHMRYIRDILAQHELGIAQYYMQRKAFVAAANRASSIIQFYSQSPTVEEALVVLVQANRALQQEQTAADALQILKANFPNSSYLKELES